MALWKEVLAVYTIKNNTDPNQPPSFIEIDDAAKKELSKVFWDMTEISHTTKQQEIQEFEVSDDGNGNLTENQPLCVFYELYDLERKRPCCT